MDGTVVKAKVAWRVDQSRKVVSATFHVKYMLAGPGSGDQFVKENENHIKYNAADFAFIFISL